MDKGLLIGDYPIWKKVRPVVSPTFSSGKIKQVRIPVSSFSLFIMLNTL